MASKNNMIEEMTDVYHKYRFVLEQSGITFERYFKWLNKFETHAEIRKAYAFIFSGSQNCLYRFIILANRVAKDYDPDHWINLRILDPSHAHVKLLDKGCQVIRMTWKSRPKPPRRGSE